MSGKKNELRVRFRVTTPLFCGGADLDRAAELRVPSLKGLLRFWWRALPEHGQLASDELAKREAALFGSSHRDIGRSRVLLQLDRDGETVPVTKGQRLGLDGKRLDDMRGKPIGMGARYLGYGLMHAFGSKEKGTMAGELERSCIVAPVDFTLNVRLHPDVKADQCDQLEDALFLMGTLGGMGSRARRGYGSLSLVCLTRGNKTIWPPPEGAFGEALVRKIETFWKKSQEALPAWTAFSRQTCVVLVHGNEAETPVSLLDRIGREMVRYRSWGTSRNGTIDGRGKILGDEPSNQKFKFDHDLMKSPANQRKAHPQRIAFGLPHNYGSKPQDKVAPAGEKLDRRASPLFIHIHQPALDMSPVGVLSFLPARFLPSPEDGRPEVSVGGKKVPIQDEHRLYAPIRGFLDWLHEGHECKERFARVERIGATSGARDA